MQVAPKRTESDNAPGRDAVSCARVPKECRFDAEPEVSLFYRYWPAQQEPATKALILLHRGHEHSGRLRHVVDELNLPDFAMFAWDARGHGLSADSEKTNPTLSTFLKDLDVFVRHISTLHGLAQEDIAVLGQSVGAVLAAGWVHDYAPKIRCLVLTSPAFSVRLYVPFARGFLGLGKQFLGNFHVNSYVKAKALTHDPERIRSYETDPLIRRPIPVQVLLGLYSASDRIIEDAQAIRCPVQLLTSGTDYVVHLKPQREFLDRLGSKVKEQHVFDGFYHDTLGEKDRHLPIGKAREFLLKMFAQPVPMDSLVDADRRGPTRNEFDALSKALPALSLKGMNFGFSRFIIGTVGRLSEGIRLGLETGFDSGSTLDYVYRNRPSGFTPIGKLIDWIYLNSIGWRGIRVRKTHVERLLANAIERLKSRGLPVRILDTAAGHGRYILDALSRNDALLRSSGSAQALLRDYSDRNVELGNKLIREKGLQTTASFEKGDAFDRKSLAAIRPRPTLGVVSGLYELFPDNSLLRESLGGLADAIEPGGFLIYTGQPRHPQLEMIARVLSSHRDNKPWIMRRRTQAEIDQLVESAGFRKVDQFIDEWGIFTVSLAERIS